MNSAPSAVVGQGRTPRAINASRLDGSRNNVSREVVWRTPPTLRLMNVEPILLLPVLARRKGAVAKAVDAFATAALVRPVSCEWPAQGNC